MLWFLVLSAVVFVETMKNRPDSSVIAMIMVDVVGTRHALSVQFQVVASVKMVHHSYSSG